MSSVLYDTRVYESFAERLEPLLHGPNVNQVDHPGKVSHFQYNRGGMAEIIQGSGANNTRKIEETPKEGRKI